MRSYQTPPPKGNPPDPFAALVDDRLQAEADVVGAMLARPMLGIARTIEHGVDGAMFADVELRMLVDAALVTFNAGVLAGDVYDDRRRIVGLARVALEADGLSHDRQAEHFAAIAYGVPFHNPGYLSLCIARLGIAAGEVDEARKLSRRLAELTEGRAA